MIFQVGDHQPYQPLMMFFAHLRLRTDPAPYYLKPLKTAQVTCHILWGTIIFTSLLRGEGGLMLSRDVDIDDTFRMFATHLLMFNFLLVVSLVDHY